MSAPADKDAFHVYLENTGMIDTLTNLLVDLLDTERHPQPADTKAIFLRQLADILNKTDDVTLLKQEIERLKAEKVAAAHKIEELENVIKQLRAGAAPAHPQHAPAPHHR